jgi:hypothetical protein
MAAHTPSIHVFLGRPLFLLSPGIHSINNFGSLAFVMKYVNEYKVLSQMTMEFPSQGCACMY